MEAWRAFLTAHSQIVPLVSQDLSAIPVSIPVLILFNSQLFQVTPAQLYYAKMGKTGHTK